MFKELNDNLTSIEREVSKLKTAVAHIEQSKEAAAKAVLAAETINIEFREHLKKVTVSVDSILKPQKDLVVAIENLIKNINAIDFPKQLNQIKIIAISVGVIALIGIILILILR